MDVQVPGNKQFICPACNEPVIVSILIGYQSYYCRRANREISIEEQVKVFNRKGITYGIEEYKKELVTPCTVIPVPRFPILSEWCCQVAIREGYSYVEAQSIALARARAESANQHIRTLSEYTYDGKQVTPRIIPKSPITVLERNFMGASVPITIRPDGKLRGVYYKNGSPQLCRPDTFETIVVERLKHEQYKEIQRALHSVASCFSDKDLETQGKFLWTQFAPDNKQYEKPVGNDPSYFRLGVIDDLINKFSVPYVR